MHSRDAATLQPETGSECQSFSESWPALKRIPSWVEPLAIVAASAAALFWSWLCWTDPLVDFGRELYVPWQLAEGRRLYGDIAYFNGPLSPYLNSFWFRIFGVSLRALAFCNAAIATVVALVLFRIFRGLSGRFGGLLAALTFLALFAYIQLLYIGNYNWICPYSHEMTHGLALALLAIYSFPRERESRPLAFASGLCLGLAFLTKSEIFAAAAASVMAMVAATCIGQGSARFMRRHACSFAVGMVLPPLLGFAWLSAELPAYLALRGLLGSWMYAFSVGNATSPYFSLFMGLARPWENLARILGVAIAWLIFWGAAAAASMACRRGNRQRVMVLAASFVAAVAVLAAGRLFIRPWHLFMPLPLLMAGLIAQQAMGVFKKNRGTGLRTVAVLRLGMAVFALFLLIRMILYARIHHYGFALAVPAVLLLVVMLAEWLPEAIARRGGNSWVFLAVFMAAWLVVLGIHMRKSQDWFEQKQYRVGSGADAFLADQRGAYAQLALEYLKTNGTPDSTMAVIPDGDMLNYLARYRSPVPFTNFNPHQLEMFGEENMLRKFQEAPPEFIVFVHAGAGEYGHTYFGHDHGLRLAAWITRQYRVVHVVGAPPFNADNIFGVSVLRYFPQNRGADQDRN